MAWTTPRSWTGGELVTDTIMNAHVRDNLNYLYGQYATAVIEVFTPSSAVTTGDGKKYFPIRSQLNGMNLVEVSGQVITAGTTGPTQVQIYNVTDAVDMLSTLLTIDSAETSSLTAGTAAVIDTTKDDVATGDLLRIDIDAVSTTAPAGYVVTLGFARP